MALQLTATHYTGLVATDAYWKIATVTFDIHARNIQVEVRAYVDQQASQNEMPPVAVKTFRFEPNPHPNEDGDMIPASSTIFTNIGTRDFLADLYTFIKTTVRFQGAIDV